MLAKEQITDNIVRYYSDNNKYIIRVEDSRIFEYREDSVNSSWTYEETDIDIVAKENEENS